VKVRERFINVPTALGKRAESTSALSRLWGTDRSFRFKWRKNWGRRGKGFIIMKQS
jgi:transposase-like protein